jgi:hypothetical protein
LFGSPQRPGAHVGKGAQEPSTHLLSMS